MLNHNLNISTRRFELQAYVDVINTADAFKLSRLSKLYNSKIFLYLLDVYERHEIQEYHECEGCLKMLVVIFICFFSTQTR